MIVIITLTFFVNFNLAHFSMIFKNTYVFDFNDVNFNARLSLPK